MLTHPASFGFREVFGVAVVSLSLFGLDQTISELGMVGVCLGKSADAVGFASNFTKATTA